MLPYLQLAAVAMATLYNGIMTYEAVTYHKGLRRIAISGAITLMLLGSLCFDVYRLVA